MDIVYTHWLTCPAAGKIAVFLGAWLLLWYPIAVLLGRQLGWQPWQPVTPPQKLPLVLSLYVLAPVIITVVLRWEGQSLGDYGLRFTLGEVYALGAGVGLALLGLAVTFSCQIATGLISWHPDRSQSWLTLVPLLLPLAMAIALVEELIFRGIFQNQLQSEYSPGGAAVLISGIFAVLHLLWERRQTIPQLPGLWLLGMVLVLARWLDGGNLALAWGLHGGWVFGLASLDASGLLTYPDADGNRWVGPYNQPLSGLGGLLCLGITGLMLLGYGFWADPLLSLGQIVLNEVHHRW
ncbi:MAG: type II CAAX endopeptidase family protein [Synechocystis sp.]|nr:type II CAAX endopeptidase family protein [Synechocystis sp.]